MCRWQAGRPAGMETGTVTGSTVQWGQVTGDWRHDMRSSRMSSFHTCARNVLVWTPSFILKFKGLRIPISGWFSNISSSQTNCTGADGTAVLGCRQVSRFLYPLGEERVHHTHLPVLLRTQTQKYGPEVSWKSLAAPKWASGSATGSISL